MGDFRISLSAELDYIPLISKKLLEYFSEFVKENILTEKKIILTTKWLYELAICIEESDFDYIEQPGHRNFPSENKKYFVVFLPPQLIKNCIDNKGVPDLIYECICRFLLNNFSKIDNDYLKLKKELLDWKYLLSIPYPAEESEVFYMNMPLREFKEMFLS